MLRIRVTAGTGERPTALAAFDGALLEAGIANYNLIQLSSVIPDGATVEAGHFIAPADQFGYRLYLVMASCQEMEIAKEAWAGLGWVQEPTTRRGLFVEATGPSRDHVASTIDATLRPMMADRDMHFGPIHSHIVGIECRGLPVCAVVGAVYRSEGWD